MRLVGELLLNLPMRRKTAVLLMDSSSGSL